MLRFISFVSVQDNDCWIWTGCVNGNGYPRFGLTHDKNVAAHRFSYEHFNGQIPNGLTIDHQCNTKLCVNPAHLRPMTMRENVLRGGGPAAINSRKTHCKRGHKFTEANTILFRGGKGRMCRTCNVNRTREWRNLQTQPGRRITSGSTS